MPNQEFMNAPVSFEADVKAFSPPHRELTGMTGSVINREAQVRPSQNQKRVLHIDFSGQGVMTHVLAILDHADSRKYQHFVLHGKDKLRPAMDHYATELADRKVPAWVLEVRRNINASDIGVLINTMKIVDEVKPSIIHCHSAKGGVIGRLAGLLKGRIPVVYTPHAFSFLAAGRSRSQRSAYLSIEKLMGKFTNQILAVSENERNLAIEAGIAPAQSVTAVPNGVDITVMNKARSRRDEMRQKLGLGPSDFILCFIGRLVEQKAPLVVPKVAAFLKKLGHFPTFLIIGDGPLAPEFEALMESLDVKAQFRMLGWRSRSDALAFVAASDILLLPSIYEGLPYAPLEAQALGTVPIITRFEGAEEAISDGTTGLLVPIGDYEAMATAVHSLIADPALLSKLSKSGPDFIQRERDVVSTVLSIESVYDKAAS